LKLQSVTQLAGHYGEVSEQFLNGTSAHIRLFSAIHYGEEYGDRNSVVFGTAAAMSQNEQTAKEHSTPEQQPPGRLDHPAWCVVWTVQLASTLKHSEDADENLRRQSCGWTVSARYDGAVPLRQRYARTHNRK